LGQKPEAALLDLTVGLAKVAKASVAQQQAMLEHFLHLVLEQVLHDCAAVVVLLVVLVAERNAEQVVLLAALLERADDAVSLVEGQLQHFEERRRHDDAVRAVETVKGRDFLFRSFFYLLRVGCVLLRLCFYG
jgi:hypothetical protein